MRKIIFNLIIALSIGTISFLGVYYFASYEPLFKQDFISSEQQANQLAQRVKESKILETPFIIGDYQVKAVGINKQGIVYFWTKLNRNGNSGLVQNPNCKGFNELLCVKISNDWAYLIED